MKTGIRITSPTRRPKIAWNEENIHMKSNFPKIHCGGACCNKYKNDISVPE